MPEQLKGLGEKNIGGNKAVAEKHAMEIFKLKNKLTNIDIHKFLFRNNHEIDFSRYNAIT